MTDVETVATPVLSPVPSPPPVKKVKVHDPDRLLRMAKQIVVDNYNDHRDPRRSRALTMDQVYIVWFAKTLSNWKAIVASATVRGFLWEVTCNDHRNEVYVDVYKKFNNTKVVIEPEEQSA